MRVTSPFFARPPSVRPSVPSRVSDLLEVGKP